MSILDGAQEVESSVGGRRGHTDRGSDHNAGKAVYGALYSSEGNEKVRQWLYRQIDQKNK